MQFISECKDKRITKVSPHCGVVAKRLHGCFLTHRVDYTAVGLYSHRDTVIISGLVDTLHVNLVVSLMSTNEHRNIAMMTKSVVSALVMAVWTADIAWLLKLLDGSWWLNAFWINIVSTHGTRTTDLQMQITVYDWRTVYRPSFMQTMQVATYLMTLIIITCFITIMDKELQHNLYKCAQCWYFVFCCTISRLVLVVVCIDTAYYHLGYNKAGHVMVIVSALVLAPCSNLSLRC